MRGRGPPAPRPCFAIRIDPCHPGFVRLGPHCKPRAQAAPVRAQLRLASNLSMSWCLAGPRSCWRDSCCEPRPPSSLPPSTSMRPLPRQAARGRSGGSGEGCLGPCDIPAGNCRVPCPALDSLAPPSNGPRSGAPISCLAPSLPREAPVRPLFRRRLLLTWYPFCSLGTRPGPRQPSRLQPCWRGR